MGKEEHITFHEKDIVAVTEAVVARTQGNYASTDDIAKDCRTKFGCDTVAVTFPILSRNRIAICLKGIAKAFKKIISCELSSEKWATTCLTTIFWMKRE